MALVDVLNAVNYTGFSAAGEATIAAAITNTYNNSATARTMYEDWVSAGNSIPISNVPNVFRAYTDGTGRVEIDIPYIDNLYYIDDNGNSVKYPFEMGLVHEFVHAFEILRDQDSPSFDAPSGGYKGDTVIFTNDIHQEMGYPNRNSYIGTNFDNIINPNFSYTGGVAIDRSVARDDSWSATGNLLKGTLFSDDLLIGGPSANSLEGNLGDDFLFGAGGDDFLNGGIGGTDTVVLSGKPIDYDIRLNADGTWTSEHVRGAMDEGTDTFQNLERVRFVDSGDTFNLSKSGLTWQTDFAFVIDQTGSMGDDIAAVKTAANGVVNALYANSTIDARIGIVGFRDNTIGEPTTVILPFTDQDDFAARQSAAVSAINGISVSGGGDFPETAYDGLLTALDGSMGDWRVGAGVKKVALFTDASAKDAILLPAVLTYALSIGATVTSSATASFGEVATVDSFELTFGDASGIFPDTEPDAEELPPYVPSGDPIEAPGGTAIVQVTTIFIDTFISPDPSFEELASATGGSVEIASNPAEVVERLLEIITTTNYNLSVDNRVIEEGDSGTTEVSFTISRDRVDSAATVTFETTGDASSADVTGAPTAIDFDAGEVAKTFTVSVIGDTDVEVDETFGMRIADVTGTASFSSAATSFVIRNDDDESSLNEIDGTDGRDNLIGTAADDAIRSLAGSYDKMFGDEGADQFIFGDEATNGTRERDVILDYEVGIDTIVLEGSAFVGSIRETSSSVVIFLDGDRDAIYVRGDGVTADNLTIVTDDVFGLV